MSLNGKLVFIVAGFVFSALLALAAQTFALNPSQAEAETICNKYAAPGGSDSAAGTESAPYRNAQKLADSLSAGQVGCLRGGVYTEADKELRVGKAGIELRSVPGERAEIEARIFVPMGSDGVTFRELNLDGSPKTMPSPQINANNTKWIDNDITNNHTGICFNVGHKDWGIATGTLIQDNRIHDCGRLPRTNIDHGVYVNAARDTKVLDNLIYDNADRGIQLRPDAQDTLIKGNVIDGNGQGVLFGGDYGLAAKTTTVTNNVISNSQARWNVESFYPEGNPIGNGNVVENNCLYVSNSNSFYNTNGGVKGPQLGFVAKNNKVSNPQYVDRAAKDFRLRAGSPCSATLTGEADGNELTPNTAPEVTDPQLAPGSTTRDRTPDLAAIVQDSQTDLTKSNITLYLDGKRVDGFSYDGTSDKLGHTTSKLGIAQHTVKIVASDEQGLTETETWSFKVVR